VSIFSFTEYLKYRWAAKDRHGVHSPFVYAFNDEVLSVSRNEEDLISNIKTYFGIKKTVTYSLTPKGETCEINNPKDQNAVINHKGKKSSLVFNELTILNTDGNGVPAFFDRHLSGFKPDDMVIIRPIYNAPNYKNQWVEIQMNQKIKLSIDLYSMGLLFFREEFKEKQHFVLKF